MVTSTKELIWSNKAFLAGNEVSEGHVGKSSPKVLIENGESEGCVSVRKQLVWGRHDFSIQNWARKGHVICRKWFIFGLKRFFDREFGQ